jgi:bacillolysin
MNSDSIRKLAPLVLVVMVGMLIYLPSAAAAPLEQAGDGFRALSGTEAASFVVSGDMRLVRDLALGNGLRYERYQQYFGDAAVLGGQITVNRAGSGTISTVIGAHYANIVPTNTISRSKDDAAAVAQRDVGAGDSRAVELLIDPATGRYFYRVETRGFDSRRIHWVDAGNGRVLKKYDALESDHGIGVKGDTKSLSGLTTFHNAAGHGVHGPHWDLFSTDNRQWTFDAQNSRVLFYATDDDNHWTTATNDGTWPDQSAPVDAQFYANTTDDYYQAHYGFDWQSCYVRQQSVAHFATNYNNAFWNGTYTVYGDGDGTIFRSLSGGLDVVAHEHTHGITGCTSNLIYQNESGALNESFSDMLGNSAEFFANEAASSNCVKNPGQSACADWWIGEDVYLPADIVVGFRNMADPREDDDPDHYSERQIGGSDNGGVHSNSGIPNHAFYLLVNGGKNAGCDNVGSNGHTHTANCDVSVKAAGLAAAEQIFFLGFTSLSENASMCNARSATVASAHAVAPQWTHSTEDAWEAVGVTEALCGS